ncbi:MAG TPA: diaminopimelate epimerase [Vicinamibacterales bacterium]|nr:diaminopimelate epimerase [Vicinamibacterales bacterium]
MRLVKAHALGNDFLLVDEAELASSVDRAAVARAVCDRHRGLGADGLIAYSAAEPLGMALLNADGSFSEISGNGVRCLAAWHASRRSARPGDSLAIHTDAGLKELTLLECEGPRFLFRAAMGRPENIERACLDVAGVPVDAVTLRVGNPQCVVLGWVTPERLHTLAAALAVHPHFPAGTNVELAEVLSPGRVRILIWERGVGPTEASGTGACAAAVAAMQYGGAARDVAVESPGGTQRVEWLDDGLYLTGTAEIVAACEWLGAVPGHA